MKTVKVVAAVICDGNRIFSAERGYGNNKGWWEFPGGKVEEGETPENALIREIKEELDSDISVDEYIDTVEYDYPDFHLSMRCYFCTLVAGNLTLLEAENSKWMTLESIESVNWFPADRLILEKIKNRLKSFGGSTIKYYDNNAEDYYGDTANILFTEVEDRFLSHIKKGSLILDYGCGSGRDTKYFISKGYMVEAIDGSEKMCEIARNYTGIFVKHMMFSDLCEKLKYDGIWACSSILHLSKSEIFEIFEKMICALKDNGYIYSSFKYGTFEGYRGERYFTDFTEDSFIVFISEIENMKITELWISEDVRPGREGEKWLNIILQKV